MITTKEEQSLTEMLMYAGIPKLPDPYIEKEESLKPEDVWVKAIARIQRKNGEIDYAVVEHDFFSWNELKIKKNVGTAGIAHSVLGLYPYDFLKTKNVPEVSNKKEIIDYVSIYMKEDVEYLQSLKKDVLKKMFYNVCIKNQISKKTETREFGYYNLGKKEPKEEPKEKENGKENDEIGGNTGTGSVITREDEF